MKPDVQRLSPSID